MRANMNEKSLREGRKKNILGKLSHYNEYGLNINMPEERNAGLVLTDKINMERRKELSEDG